jgi:hypothetical protein
MEVDESVPFGTVENHSHGDVTTSEADYADVVRRASGFVKKRLGDVLLASVVARPDTFQLLRPYLTYTIEGDEEPVREELYGLENSLEVPVVEPAKKFGWPPFTPVSIGDVLAWMLNTQGIDEGLGKGRLGRALAALSTISFPETAGYSSCFLWTLIGLEALYCEGNEGLMSQMHEKTQIYLGSRESFKGIVKHLYNTRSNFVHGRMDIPLSYTPWDAHPEFGEFFDNITDQYYLAVAILIATLQKMASENRYKLNFGYTLLD